MSSVRPLSLFFTVLGLQLECGFSRIVHTQACADCGGGVVERLLQINPGLEVYGKTLHRRIDAWIDQFR